MVDKYTPAFPHVVQASAEHLDPKVVDGMSLRAYFAAHALQGLLAANWCAETRSIAEDAGNSEVVNDAVKLADKMLKYF